MNIEQEIKNIELQLEVLKQKQAEDNTTKAKTGRVLSMDDLVKKEKYFYLSPFRSDTPQSMPFEGDHAAFAAGNMFHDKEAAEKELERNQLVQRMRIAANADGGVDWDDSRYNKYCIFWQLENDGYYVDAHRFIRATSLPYFTSDNRLSEFINSLNHAQQKLLICGVD